MASTKTSELLGEKAEGLLTHKCIIDKSTLTLPSPTYIDDIFVDSNRNNRVVGSLQTLMSHGRLADTGYCSIFPVDQGVEHTAGASFSPNPIYFDPENIVKLAVESGCNGVASTFGVLGILSRKYAHKIPFIVKINHNELMTYPNKFDEVMFGTVRSAYNMGAVGIGATIYWGSQESNRQLQQVSEAFELAHELGMCTILWCYTRNNAFCRPHRAGESPWRNNTGRYYKTKNGDQ
jgi:class I fructose-bisphosphate aldolase